MSRKHKAVIGVVITAVMLPLCLFGLGFVLLETNSNAVGRLKFGMTRAQVRSELRFYHETTVDWRVTPNVRQWFYASHSRHALHLAELDVRTYELMRIPSLGKLFVAYDKTGHVAAIQEYD